MKYSTLPSTFLGFLFISLLFGCTSDNTLLPSEYSSTLNKRITGDIAYETTAFIEKYWRVVGNTGFNKSIYKITEGLENAGYVLE